MQSKKLRGKAISRFSHSSEIILKNCFKSCDIPELKKIDPKEKCYIISNGEKDGNMIFMSDAIEYCENSYMTVILISEKFVALKEEYEKKPVILISA